MTRRMSRATPRPILVGPTLLRTWRPRQPGAAFSRASRSRDAQLREVDQDWLPPRPVRTVCSCGEAIVPTETLPSRPKPPARETSAPTPSQPAEALHDRDLGCPPAHGPRAAHGGLGISPVAVKALRPRGRPACVLVLQRLRQLSDRFRPAEVGLIDARAALSGGRLIRHRVSGWSEGRLGPTPAPTECWGLSARSLDRFRRSAHPSPSSSASALRGARKAVQQASSAMAAGAAVSPTRR
jgi:hypothetical protein